MLAEPAHDCRLCSRLAAFRDGNRSTEPEWFNAPVPSFGSDDAELLIVGLAPGLRGANRTGRPFTGDFAGDLLYATLCRFGFAEGDYDRRPDDDLTLRNCTVTNAVRCVPPQNKPLPAEIKACRTFLAPRLNGMPRLRAIVALGRIAHESVIRALAQRLADAPFGHGRRHSLETEAGRGLTLFDSFHCSRYNTNTGLLTEDMFAQVFADVRFYLEAAAR